MKTTHGLRLGGRRGAALVEFVLVLPLLMLLVFGMVEMGLLIKDKLALNQVAREGVRCAALRGTSASVTSRVNSWSTKLGLKTADVTAITLAYTDPSTGGATASPPPPGSDVAVTLTYRHRPITKIIPVMPNPTIIKATMVMTLE
jgi:Flp pilus assembly protein TadG